MSAPIASWDCNDGAHGDCEGYGAGGDDPATLYPCPCECHDDADDYADDYADDDRNGPCIGTDCCNPAIDHRRDECATVEMIEAWAATEEK